MINIAEKLKNAPSGMKLWTEMFGDVTYVRVTADQSIVVHTPADGDWKFDCYGRYTPNGMPVLWPSEGCGWDEYVPGKAWDPADLRPYDQVLVMFDHLWVPTLLSGYHDGCFYLVGHDYQAYHKVLPYRDPLKDLAWTDQEPAPEWKIW